MDTVAADWQRCLEAMSDAQACFHPPEGPPPPTPGSGEGQKWSTKEVIGHFLFSERSLNFPSMPGKPMAMDIYESLDQSHTHCPPCPDLVSTYEKTTVLGREVLLSRSPSEEFRSRIVAYFWLRDVFVTLVIRHENVAIALPSPAELEVEILRIAESMIGRPT